MSIPDISTMVDYELHVWGCDKSISVVFPECLAAAWLVTTCIPHEKINIVTLSNTNLSKTGVLPVLLTKDVSYEGFGPISSFILSEFSGKNVIETKDLAQSAVILLIENKLVRVHQFNLYSNLKNYEEYTRKQFKKYLPFPMMYNQPLKLYNVAQDQVRMAGLLPSPPGLFGVFSGSSGPHDEVDEETSEVALSALHERQMTAKSNKRELLRQSKNSLKCLNYLGEILDDIVKLNHQLNPHRPDDTFALIFNESKISVAELLLFAYIHSLTYDGLPDHAIHDYIRLKYLSFADFSQTKINELNQLLDDSAIQPPNSSQVPNLINEVRYRLGY